MKVLVLGGTGFIGINIVHQLQGEGFDIRVFHRHTSARRFLLEKDVHFFVGNLDDPASLEQAMADCDAVVHAAGYYPVYALKKEQQVAYAVSQMRNVLDAARKNAIKRLVYISSLATLGRPHGAEELVDEDTPYDPNDFPATYHQIKYQMEKLVMSDDDLSAIVLIPTAVFGPFDHKPTTGRIILDTLKGKLPVYLDGKMNAVDVRDIAKVVANALKNRQITGRFILGNWNTTLKDFLGMVAQIGGVKSPVIRFPWSLATPLAHLSEYAGYFILRQKNPLFPVTGLDLLKYSAYVSYEKAHRAFNFSPSPISVAIRDAIAWFRENNY